MFFPLIAVSSSCHVCFSLFTCVSHLSRPFPSCHRHSLLPLLLTFFALVLSSLPLHFLPSPSTQTTHQRVTKWTWVTDWLTDYTLMPESVSALCALGPLHTPLKLMPRAPPSRHAPHCFPSPHSPLTPHLSPLPYPRKPTWSLASFLPHNVYLLHRFPFVSFVFFFDVSSQPARIGTWGGRPIREESHVSWAVSGYKYVSNSLSHWSILLRDGGDWLSVLWVVPV